MIRKLFPVLFAAAMLAGCTNSGNKNAASSSVNPGANTLKVEFASLTADPGAYIGKTISVEGKVVHVCTMSGKKLFITGDNPDVVLYVQAGENMPKFPMDLLGSKVIVEGTLTKSAGSEMGMEMSAKNGNGMMSSDTCETEKALAAQPVLADLMMVYNKHEVVK